MGKNKVEIVGLDTNIIKSISSKRTRELLEIYIKQNDKEALDELVIGNLKLVLSLVNRFSRRNNNLDDLFHIGVMGLIKAINNFDLSQEVRFSTYAVPMIDGEIRRYLRDSSTLRVSRQIKDLAYHYMKEKEAYINEYGYMPTNEEMARKLEVKKNDLVEAIESTYPISSINEPIYNDFDESIVLEDTLPNHKDEEERRITYVSLHDGIEKLPNIERTIIKMRYYEGLSQVEISTLLKISQAQVSRLEKNALSFLKKFVWEH